MDYKNLIEVYVIKDHHVEVEEILVEPACDKLDGFVGEILRLKVTTSAPFLEHGTTSSFIIKKKHENNRSDYDVDKLFSNEIRAYSGVISKLETFRHQYSNKDSLVYPKCYLADLETPDMILLEDLRNRGYRLADSAVGLDLDHCLQVIEALAKFHGTSIALSRTNPTEFAELASELDEVIYLSSNKNNILGKIWNSSVEFALFNLSQCNKRGFNSVIKWLDNVKHDVLQTVLNLIGDCDIPAVCHGDLWTKNIMFRFSDGNGDVGDAVLIDLQAARIGHPVQDLLHFLCSSSASLSLNISSIIREYTRKINKELEEFNSPPLPEPAVMDAVLKYSPYGLLVGILMIPATTVLPDSDVTVDDLLGEDRFENWSRSLSVVYRERLLDLVSGLLQVGLLDVLNTESAPS